MPGKDVTVRVRASDGAWETLGSDRARGVWPENVELTADRWGAKTATFELRRDPKAIWPDLQAFTQVEIDVAGRKRWAGRVAQTPVRDDLDSVISVQCEGWQAHLDDDLYERIYVHTNLADWQDNRSSPTETLGAGGYFAAGSVSTSGAITLTVPSGSPVLTATRCGCYLDLGPGSTAKRVVVTYETSNNVTDKWYVLGSSEPQSKGLAAAQYEVALNPAVNAAASGTLAATFTTAWRYVHLYLEFLSGYTPGADVWVKFTSVQVFADAAYESGNASVLKSDQVVKDALDKATLLTSSDRSKIVAGSFNLPEFAPSGPRTPRQAWEAVDAFEDRYKKINNDAVAVYKDKPSAPDLEVGAWSSMTFEDASAGDGGDVYNRVIVVAEEPDGTPLRVQRSQAQQTGVAVVEIPGAVTNPGFETNTTGWTATTSTITRDTGVKRTGNASGRWDNTGASDALGAGDYLETTLSGTFLAGVPYTATFYYRAAGTIYVDVTLGVIGTDSAITSFRDGSSSSWTAKTVTWTPSATRSASVVLRLTAKSPTSSYVRIDDVSVASAKPTIVDRQGFRRSKTIDASFKLTASAAQQIADKWLLAHQRTPFKGRVTLTGSSVREILTGRDVGCEELLDRTDELLRFTDRIDPDSGAVGRDGRMVEVSYRPAMDEATVTIDSSRAGFEALLERLGVVLQQGLR